MKFLKFKMSLSRLGYRLNGNLKLFAQDIKIEELPYMSIKISIHKKMSK